MKRGGWGLYTPLTSISSCLLRVMYLPLSLLLYLVICPHERRTESAQIASVSALFFTQVARGDAEKNPTLLTATTALLLLLLLYLAILTVSALTALEHLQPPGMLFYTPLSTCTPAAGMYVQTYTCACLDTQPSVVSYGLGVLYHTQTREDTKEVRNCTQ